ncbi:tripartite tricarboxylate transporter substrate binding protein [Limnohabitans sp. Rim8]|uniref:Bug family tripartite tricarboxylate transporter substrate binding protein n=1 Tax=Limnohabitans sp. Rim8 TaxID=1100718 RepID=UPI0033067A78
MKKLDNTIHPHQSRRRCLLAFAGASLAMGPLSRLQAAAYPERSVTIVCPFPPGGGSDNVARLIAQHASTFFGQPFIVDNRSGAAGTIGVSYAAKAKPDGYTLIYLSSAVTIQPALQKLPYDIVRDLSPVSMVIKVPYVLATSANSRFKSLDHFVAEAKRGERITYGTYGMGSPPHLTMEQLQSSAKFEITHVPYRGEAASVLDLLAGAIDVAWVLPFAVLPHVKAGKLRLLGVSTNQRVPDLPGVAALGEVAPQIDIVGWGALMAPTGCPPHIIASLQTMVQSAVNVTANANRLREQGYTPVGSSSDTLKEVIGNELVSWANLIREKNIRSE